MTAHESRAARRGQQATVLYAVTTGLLLLVSLQWVLLTVAVEGLLAGQADLLGTATLASGGCCLAACWLIRHLPAVSARGTTKGVSDT